MILKNFNVNENIFQKNSLFLFYGNNEGFKDDEILKITKNKNLTLMEEKEILNDTESFFNNINSGSLFDKEKIILIKRVTDKIYKIIEEINQKKTKDIKIILNSGALDKKSKLRNLFEKNKDMICIAYYPDTNEILLKLAKSFLERNKISISNQDINLIVNKCGGDRIFLKNELNKIFYYSVNKKKISTDNIKKLVNLAENYNISELIDNCLAKNEKKTLNILNENNFNNEDCILITRTFINKSKKILKLSEEFRNNKNIDQVISSAKPPIFWKDKEITMQQIYKRNPKDLKNLIYKLSELEFYIKKNINNSLKLITDFILNQSSTKTSN